MTDDGDSTREDSLIRAVARIPPRAIEDWRPPSELDEYRLLRPLGRGGMGSVWLAQDRLLDRLVAVKFIAHAEPDPGTRERFAIEARAAARLQHVNVVTVHRFGEVAGRPYLVSEYIRGDSLEQLAKPVGWERCLELGIELARGLAAAHRHGIVHRDLKPGNAILTADGHAKLVDFGLARLAPGELAIDTEATTDPAGAVDAAALTRPGAIAGTPRYLAPEVRGGQPATRASDVYQVGCILYELATGHAPIFDLPRERADAEVPPLAERLPGPAGRFAAAVDRCLRRDPARRFASGDELREALERIAPAAPGGELPEGNPYRGLRAFDAEHRALFFGRGADIRAVIERLRADPFVVVAGDSGVGKSSLCRAGVLPHVVDGALGDGRAWSAIAVVPGRRPLTALAHAAAAELGVDAGALASALHGEPARLVRELRRAHGQARGAVVFVDQLEELTTLAEPDERRAFAAVLGQLALGAPGLRLLATVRGDYLARGAELPAIGAELARSLYLLRSLTLDGAREAVAGPARAKGARFESDALVETLVASVAGPEADVARPAIELPLLAFTLAELWDARDVATETISARSLDAIGGVRGALASHADRVLDSLVPAQRAAARKLLLRLVTPERTRARRTADELAGLDRGALDALVRGRLVVARGGDEPTFELAHERLIDGWPALAGWLSETAEAAAVRARLSAAVADWHRLAHKDLLWSERRLADLAVVDAGELAPDEARFVAASRRALRRRRWWRRGVAIALPVAVASLYIAARVVARRDIDQRIAVNLGEADRALVIARAADTAAADTAGQAYAQFDAGEAADGESSWDAARALADRARGAYGEATRALEAAFLVDTERDDVRDRLAELTYERLQIAERDHRSAEHAELAARLALYDRDRRLVDRSTAPAQLIVSVQPRDAAVALIAGLAAPSPTAVGTPLPPGTSRVPPGPYIVVARAPGRAEVRSAIIVGAGEQLRIDLALPAARDVPPGFVYIPAGRFLFGSGGEDMLRHYLNGVPIHALTTRDFLIGRTEVTYQQWIEYLDALGPGERALRTPQVSASPTAQEGGQIELRRVGTSWELLITPGSEAYSARAGEPIEYCDREIRSRQDWLQFPVSGISAEDAAAYAKWLDRTGRVRHARLCSDREWERAARGADDRAYPGGDQLRPDDANIDLTYGRRDAAFGPDAVGAHPASTSVFGLADASGNVWEMTRAGRGDIVIRGGCFYTDLASAHLANRPRIPASFRHLQIGVRLCADPP